VEKAPRGLGEAMYPKATTKGNLDAFAAKILAAITIEPRVSPITSRVRSFLEVISSASLL
jgi:hypothetical protein